MMSAPDPFSASFDSIEIDRTSAPSPEAIERALAFCAPVDAILTTAAAAPDFAQPGFYLLDDCGGRFVVDREMGVVSLKEDALLLRERGAVHGMRLRVVEPSGASYELTLQLRLTGRIPQMASADEDAFLTTLAGAVTPDTEALAPPLAPTARINWSHFAAATGTPGATHVVTQNAPFGAIITPALPVTTIRAASLRLMQTLPAPSAPAAYWEI